MAALLLFTGLGGGRGGCLVPWEAEVGATDDCWVVAPAEDTDRTGLDAIAEGAEGEEYWVAGWLDGVRGGPLQPGSGVELISHFGGITDCLGGRGSRRVSRRASGSGTKWLSDSVKTQYHEDMLLNKGTHNILHGRHLKSLILSFLIIELVMSLYVAISVSVQGLNNEPFSAASPLKVLSMIALVWELHYLGISREDKQSRRLQLPPNTHLPLPIPQQPPRYSSYTIPQSCSSEVQGYLFTDKLLSVCHHTTKEEIIQKEGVSEHEEQRGESETVAGLPSKRIANFNPTSRKLTKDIANERVLTSSTIVRLF